MTEPQTETKKELTLADTIRRMEPEIALALPDHIRPERFTRNAITIINSNPDIMNGSVDKRSILSVIMLAAKDGLIIDGREAAMVTFGGKAGYIPMIEGVMKLVRNSGEVDKISVQVVKENDFFDYELGDQEFMKHKPLIKGSRGPTVGAYSIVHLKSGEISREWMDIEQLEAVRKRSRAAQKGPWVSDTDEMYRKTVFKRHAKKLPKSSDIDEFLSNDDKDHEDRDPDVVSIKTGSAAGETPAPRVRAASKRTSTAEAVSAQMNSQPVNPKPPEPPQGQNDVIDAEFTEVKDEGEENDTTAPQPEEEVPI